MRDIKGKACGVISLANEVSDAGSESPRGRGLCRGEKEIWGEGYG